MKCLTLLLIFCLISSCLAVPRDSLTQTPSMPCSVLLNGDLEFYKGLQKMHKQLAKVHIMQLCIHLHTWRDPATVGVFLDM